MIYRSRLNAKINRNFEVFTATDFLAAITQHILDKGAQMVRYYGWYDNKMRVVRHRGLPSELVPHRPGASPPPPPLKLPSNKWRDLILRVWHVAGQFIIHPPPRSALPFPRFGLRTRETGRLLGQEWLKMDKIWLLTARLAFDKVAPC